MLSEQQLAAIADREKRNAARRDQMRARWAADRPDQPKPVVSGNVVEPDEWRRGRTVAQIPIGQGEVVITRSGVYVSSGDLSIRLQKLKGKEQEIAHALMRLQAASHRWPDGTLRGIKRLMLVRGRWLSPSQHVFWDENGELHAEGFSADDALRGHNGIHAAWADTLSELNGYEGALVEIAGWGACVVGDLGWRAEHAKVVRKLICP
jgi:hypothetical protein